MATCASNKDRLEQLNQCVDLLINAGANINAFDRYAPIHKTFDFCLQGFSYYDYEKDMFVLVIKKYFHMIKIQPKPYFSFSTTLYSIRSVGGKNKKYII